MASTACIEQEQEMTLAGAATKMSTNGLTVHQLLSKEEQMRTAARGQSLNVDRVDLPSSLKALQVAPNFDCMPKKAVVAGQG